MNRTQITINIISKYAKGLFFSREEVEKIELLYLERKPINNNYMQFVLCKELLGLNNYVEIIELLFCLDINEKALKPAESVIKILTINDYIKLIPNKEIAMKLLKLALNPNYSPRDFRIFMLNIIKEYNQKQSEITESVELKKEKKNSTIQMTGQTFRIKRMVEAYKANQKQVI